MTVIPVADDNKICFPGRLGNRPFWFAIILFYLFLGGFSHEALWR